MNLGSEVPVITTSYTPIATGGAGVNPLNSVQYRPVGINVDILPRFSLEGDILIEMTLESSALGANVSVGGTDYPTFASRRVTTKLRLRDGEANLLAGLLREDERKSLSGFPGAIHVPILKQLFSNNDETIQQTDIVMLLTPHIIRTPGITADDLQPVYIGTQANIGLGGPPPIISLPGRPAGGWGRAPHPRRRRDASRRGAAWGAARRAAGIAAGRDGSAGDHSRARDDRRTAGAAGARGGAAARTANAASGARAGDHSATSRATANDRGAGDRAARTGDDARVRGGAESPVATAHVPCRRRSVHGADLDHERVAAVDDHA